MSSDDRPSLMNEDTKLFHAIEAGDRHAAAELLPLVCEELRVLAAHRPAQEKPGRTLEPTALVLSKRKRPACAVVAGFLVSVVAFLAPATVRGDLRPRSPKPPPRPTFAGGALPRPLNVVVAGTAVAAAVAGAGILLFRAGGEVRGVLGWGTILVASVILVGASALAYWSFSTERQYEAVKAKQQADYEARLRNYRPHPMPRPPGPVDPPVSKAISARVRP
jgi:ECF sigma factor